MPPQPALHFRASVQAAVRAAPPLDLSEDLVREHLLEDGVAERQFKQAFEDGLASLKREDRHGGLNAITGHVAESVVASLLVELGWIVVRQFTATSSGGHGIDLAVLTPTAEALYVVEVKGSLSPRRWPRLTSGDLDQFSSSWLDRDDNPGMADLGVSAADVYGLVVLVSFARRKWKAAATSDFERATPIVDADQLSS